MRFRRNVQLLATTTAAALAVSLAPAALAADDTAEFTISNITDFHGYWKPTDKVPGAAALKCSVDKVAEGKTHIFTSAGDNIGASPFESMLLDDQPTLDLLNLMGLKVSAIGNHEFDHGASDVEERVVKQADFDYLGANAHTIDGVKDYTVEELDGVKVAFVGTVTDDMPNLVSPDNIKGITWDNPVETTNALAKKLKDSGEADVVVALVHEGNLGPDDFSKDVDLAFLGHTHQVIEPGQTSPVVIQAGEYGKHLANVDLSFDRATKKATVKHAELLDADAIRACDTPEPEVDAIMQQAEEKAGAEGERIVGNAGTDFYRGAKEGKESGSSVGVESQLNNFVAEITRWGVDQNSAITPDIGVMNAGGVRSDLEQGDVTYADAFAVQPFGGENTYVEITGKDFVDALEQQWRDGDSMPFAALGVSDNVTYTYDPEAPQGSRITSVTVDGAPIDPAKKYVIAGSTFILGGGDHFEAFTRGTAPASLGYLDLNALVEALGAGKAKAPRGGQSNVGVHLDAPLTAGTPATINLSSLQYTLGETAKQVTVSLGDATATADIDPAYGPEGMNEKGKATVALDVPADMSGTQELHVTTDAGTDATVPVEVAPARDADEPGTPAPAGSSAADLAWILPVALAGLAGLGSLIALLLPQQVDQVLGPIAKR